jgi:hypothetical protein
MSASAALPFRRRIIRYFFGLPFAAIPCALTLGSKMKKSLFLSIALILSGCFNRSGIDSHPEDSYFESILKEKNQDLYAVISMLEEDRFLTRVAFKFTRTTGKWNESEQKWIPDEQLEESRWNIYRDHFRRIGAKMGVVVDHEPLMVSFLISTEGLSIGGSSKELTYFEGSPRNLVTTFEGLDTSAKEGTAFRRIDENWYIQLSWSN